MRAISFFGLVASLSALAIACSSSNSSSAQRVAIDAQQFCALDVTTCGDTSNGTLSECEASASVLRVAQACADLVAKATCADLAANSTLENTCFPSCASSSAAYLCNSDGTITECNGGDDDAGTVGSRTLTIDCAAGCQAENLTYTGTCSSSYQGQTSDHPQCWCQ